MSECTHPREDFTNDGAGTRNHRQPCRARICLHCRNTAPESWMSGRCHACYRITEAAIRKDRAERAERTRLRSLADAWNEGWAHYREHFSPNDAEFGNNPYRERLEVEATE